MLSIFDERFPVYYTVIFIAMSFVLGAVIGSFLNVVIIRVPRHEPISGAHNRSHCMSCGKQLSNIDLIPILSYIFLGGKCRFCKAPISPRYWIVELITAVVYTVSMAVFGISVNLVFAFILAAALIVAGGIDVDHMIIPNGCSIVIAALGIIALIISAVSGDTSLSWSDRLIGAVCVSVPFAVLMMFGAMGGGDVILMAASGLLLGWKNIIVAAALGIVLGAVGGSIELLSIPRGIKKRASKKAGEIAGKWYDEQKENGIYVKEDCSDVIYGSIFKGHSDIENECLDTKFWNGEPDIDKLNQMLDAELSDVSKFTVSIVIENKADKKHPDTERDPYGRVVTVTCKRAVVFGPYLAVGIMTAFMFGSKMIDWYFGFIR